MRGRKPKPTALKVLLGNPGKRALNRDEPTPPAGIPDPPDSLTPAALEVWPEISGMLAEAGVLTLADKWALAALTETYAERQAASRLLQREGRYLRQEAEEGREEAKKGQSKARKRPKQGKALMVHPAVRVLQDADRRLRGWLCEFGLTPSARTRVKKHGDQGRKEHPAAKYLA